MMKLHILILLSQQCFALKIQQGQQAESSAASSFYAEHPKCIDQTTEKTKPIMEAIQEFFPSKDVQPMPAALTALSAMRFGGLSMDFPRKVIFDHDFDFLLVDRSEKKRSDWNVDGVRGMIDGFLKHLLGTKGIGGKACSGGPNTNGLKPGQKRNGAWNFFVFIDKETELYGHGPFQNMIKTHFPGFIAAPVNAVVHLYHSTFDKIEQACDFNVLQTETLVKWPTSFAQLDFWVDFENQIYPQILNAPVLDSKPFLLAGVPFQNFMTNEMISEQVNNVLCSDTAKNWFDAKCEFGSKGPDICNFALLGHVVFDDEGLEASSREDADFLLKDCSRGLHEKGFMSFQSCHENTTTSA